MMDRRKSGELVVSFFIHGRGTPLQKTLLGVFRALLNSMLISFPEYLSQLTKRFNDQERRFGSYQENRWGWSEEELQEFTSEVLTKGAKNRPVVIFVDAIDECGQCHAKHLLEYFKDLMNNVEREEAQVKICFSSRHFPLLGLDTISTVSVEERNDKDIRLVIRERLKQIQPKAKRQQMEKEILLKAQGGFQWVVLITTIVIDGNTIGIKAEKLHEKITTTPEALDELYTDILSGVTEAENHQMTKLFQWVLFAERPLSAQELREALATDKDMTCTTVSELRSHDSWSDTLDDFEKHVRHISRGLVEFHTREIWEQYEPGGEDSDREVQFVHQSVADYILGKFLNHVGLGVASQSQIGAGHFEISRSCLRYLTLREVSEGAQLSRGTFSARFPLIPYVVRFVFHHIREVEREGIPQLDLLPLIQWDRQSESLRKIASIWRVMDPNNAHAPMGWPFIGATPLHVLVALGSKSAFDALLQNDVEVDGRDSDGNTPLLLALRECHQDMALALLNRSIERQLRHRAIDQSITQDKDTGHRMNHFVDINAENNDGEMPLAIALTVNAEEVIFKLIEAGADLKFFGQQTALVFYAIRNRNKTLLLKLLEKNVKLDGAVYFALKELSYKDGDDILEEFLSELLKTGANTGKSPEFDKSSEDEDEVEERDDEAILLASRRGQTAIVNLLLSYGASATSRNKHGRFPLLEAAENGHEAVARLLINNGADVNASNKDGSTPLLWALQNGHEAVAKLLINNGADVKASNKDKLTPLLWASRNGHEAVAKLLIDNGADVNASDEGGSTPLLWASRNDHEAVARLLIDNGA
ncbi:ankyrin-1 [Trichoderma asperellum]|uniref:Ankyrin-1 n=1 Tax=Trichoderma asperellum TaxID=101201 RepID=A0A6V8QQG8_TRIAP|nr:ankyrin-1 [Trichoderma asperellum]